MIIHLNRQVYERSLVCATHVFCKLKTFHAKHFLMCLFQPLTTHTECDTIGRSLLSSCIKHVGSYYDTMIYGTKKKKNNKAGVQSVYLGQRLQMKIHVSAFRGS